MEKRLLDLHDDPFGSLMCGSCHSTGKSKSFLLGGEAMRLYDNFRGGLASDEEGRNAFTETVVCAHCGESYGPSAPEIHEPAEDGTPFLIPRLPRHP
jgi:hypothetical protein